MKHDRKLRYFETKCSEDRNIGTKTFDMRNKLVNLLYQFRMTRAINFTQTNGDQLDKFPIEPVFQKVISYCDISALQIHHREMKFLCCWAKCSRHPVILFTRTYTLSYSNGADSYSILNQDPFERPKPGIKLIEL